MSYKYINLSKLDEKKKNEAFGKAELINLIKITTLSEKFKGEKSAKKSQSILEEIEDFGMTS